MRQDRQTRVITVLAVAAVLLMAAGLALFYRSRVPYPKADQKDCLYFVNGQWLPKGERPRGIAGATDYKCVVDEQTGVALYNYPEGYRLWLPDGMDFDFSRSNMVVKADAPDFSVTVSREWSPYEDVDGYLQFYQNRFYENEYFRQSNGLNLLQDELLITAGMDTRLLTLSFEEGSALPYPVYTFAYQKQGRGYVRYLFRGDAFDEDYQKTCVKVLNSFEAVRSFGEGKSYLTATPKADPNWDEETAALWRRYCEQDTVDWGIFVADMYESGIKETIPALEEKIGVPFDVVLLYLQLGTPLGAEGLEIAKQDGKVIELTLQVSANNNTDVYGYTPMFDLLAGAFDEHLTALAGQLNDFEHPILFRLNNEMNSDWTSYSGIVTMSDPDLYIAVWRYIYDFFAAQGVDNLIWVFNPNDRNYPPSNWNDFTRYWPGDDYVQMIGLTGYNTGDYYADLTGETWREFKDIYNDVEKKYSPYFGEYPWMITEFGSSSYGGDKVAWINGMFDCIDDFDNLKIAVWWSYADFDTREGKEGIAARPYFLDETPETLEAFARRRRGD